MNDRFFYYAKKVSELSDHKDHKMGAVLVHKNKVVSFGKNQMKTHTRSNTFYKTLHCELDAVLRAGRRNLENHEIYVYRETRLGKPAMARPCVHCLDMLRSVGINKAFYSTENGFHEEIL